MKVLDGHDTNDINTCEVIFQVVIFKVFFGGGQYFVGWILFAGGGKFQDTHTHTHILPPPPT